MYSNTLYLQVRPTPKLINLCGCSVLIQCSVVNKLSRHSFMNDHLIGTTLERFRRPILLKGLSIDFSACFIDFASWTSTDWSSIWAFLSSHTTRGKEHWFLRMNIDFSPVSPPGSFNGALRKQCLAIDLSNWSDVFAVFENVHVSVYMYLSWTIAWVSKALLCDMDWTIHASWT